VDVGGWEGLGIEGGGGWGGPFNAGFEAICDAASACATNLQTGTCPKEVLRILDGVQVKITGGEVACPASGSCDTILSSGYATVLGIPLSLLGTPHPHPNSPPPSTPFSAPSPPARFHLNQEISISKRM